MNELDHVSTIEGIEPFVNPPYKLFFVSPPLSGGGGGAGRFRGGFTMGVACGGGASIGSVTGYARWTNQTNSTAAPRPIRMPVRIHRDLARFALSLVSMRSPW